MSPLPISRPVVRALSLTAISALLVSISLVWASRQQAGSPSFKSARNHSSQALLADKGGITPAASTISVNSLSDVANASDGLCSLREAISAANNNTASGVAAGECAAGSNSGTDVINIAVTGTIDLNSVLPDISSDMTINGPGSSQLTVRRNSGTFRIFRVASGTAALSGVTVTNGITANGGGVSSGGGGIQNLGTLSLTDVTVTANQTGSGAFGGGIYNQGTLTTMNCSITGNSTGDGPSGPHGGGIYNAGQMTLVGTIISNNLTGNGGNSGFGGRGGGIFNGSPNASLINCTVSGNATGSGGGAHGVGGGIFNSATLTIAGSTITANVGDSAGGIVNSNTLTMTNSTISTNQLGGLFNDTAATARLTNCTVTANQSFGIAGGLSYLQNNLIAHTGGFDFTADFSGDCVTLGHNLIGWSPRSCFANGVNGDQIGTGASPLDAKLGPLANNGGPTQTHALLADSTALDAGDNCVTQPAHCNDPNLSTLTTDQRGNGFSRIVDGPDGDATATIDIGAYEMQPTLANIPNTISSLEDLQAIVPFEGADNSTFTSVTSSNPNLVPNDSAHLSGAIVGSSTGVVTINPTTNASGTTDITVTINHNSVPESKTFTLTVNPVNDAPSFTKGADQAINEDAGAQTVPNWATAISAGPADESAQALTFQVTNNTNAALFSTAPAINSSGTLTYTPAANANGAATITVNLKDDNGTANGGIDTSASQSFIITVAAVNDAPSFVKGADQVVNEDSFAQSVTNWATAISRGAADESAQTLTFQVTNNTNAALFSSGPAVSATGTLTYTPATNANGSATVTINLKDNGGTANGGVDTSVTQSFTITVNAVNDAPSFTKGANQTVNNNVGPQTVTNWATNISPGPANESSQSLTFQVTGNTNPGLFTAGPSISSTGTLTYTPSASAGGTATITINLKDDGGTANGGSDTSTSQTFTITVVNPTGGFVSFQSSTASTTENSGSTTVNVVRSGNTSQAVTVNYATNSDAGLPCSTANGVASPKCDFTAALGTLNFAAGETSKPISILISQDSFVEGPETITLTLSSPTGGAALSTPSTMSVTIADDATEPPTNVIDDARTFVRMHYHDFLNREADQSGLDFWTGQMTNCGSPDLTVCRVNVSGAFFLSIEFQQTGYLVERMYKTGYGDATATSSLGGAHQVFVPVVRASEFLTDTQRIGRGVIVLQPGWEQALENNKQAYALEFVQTTRFITALPTSRTPTQFVDQLNQNAGMVLSSSERTTAINAFGIAANTTNVNTRAQVLRQIADDQDLYNAEFNRAFVLTEYIGYLRRNPNDAPESTLDYTGYEFWLSKLNQFNGDYIAAEMVKAFISSGEYRGRFGP